MLRGKHVKKCPSKSRLKKKQKKIKLDKFSHYTKNMRTFTHVSVNNKMRQPNKSHTKAKVPFMTEVIIYTQVLLKMSGGHVLLQKQMHAVKNTQASGSSKEF
ncbi:hypothetical protein XENOCAPTIV_023793 [Xenoophorus captivus]|uniref:Uncharacterized protein n=1 Tax=Xenoophorus captivus TaxID=1517983 RepID=A0ABV0QXX6_9TELE